MLFFIINSDSGDPLGSVNIAGMDDEQILQWLCDHRYLEGAPDNYALSTCYPFAEGETVVIDLDTQRPVLKLELPPETLPNAA